MPTNRDCDYCGTDIEPGTGTMYVEVNGTVTHFCSSKCERNAGLGREARDLEWTAAGAAARGPVTAERTESVEAAGDDAAEPTTSGDAVDRADFDVDDDDEAESPEEATTDASSTAAEDEPLVDGDEPEADAAGSDASSPPDAAEASDGESVAADAGDDADGSAGDEASEE